MKLRDVFLREAEGFSTDIEEVTLGNSNFRKVLYTSDHMQLTLMTIPVDGEIGNETHNNPEGDQFFRIEQGKAKAIINKKEFFLENGDAFIVPANTEHNVFNIGEEDLKLYTIYSPAQHKPNTIHKTKDDAEKDKEDIPVGRRKE